MRLKTYLAKTLQDAMNQAKMDLGEDVIILESRKTRGNGFLSREEDLIQITAAIDDGKKTVKKSHHNIFSTSPGNNGQEHFEHYLSPMISHHAFDVGNEMTLNHEITTLRHELNKLNRRLRKMTAPDFPEPFSHIYKKLLETGISEEYAVSFVRRAYLRLDGDPDITEKTVMRSIQSEIVSLFNQNSLFRKHSENSQQIITFIGPTGVGKTTTIMKLSVHPDVCRRKNVAIISTDSYRVAASDPLKAFSKITSVPVAEVRSPDDIQSKIEEFNDRDIILVDMPGRSPFFPNYIQELERYLNVLNPTDILLILSLTSDLEDLYLSSGLYLTLNPTGIILTKIDETGRPGKIISMVEEVGLPVIYICDGQAIPSDISVASGEYIWQKIITSV